MDSKKTDSKKSVKEKISSLFLSYIGNYIEDIPKTKEELINNLPRLLIAFAKYMGCIVLGILFGSKTLFYSALPLGTSLLCSSRRYTSYIYLGLLISSAIEKTGLALPLFLIYTALYISRILIYRTYGKEEGNNFKLFNEKLSYRLIEGVSASILISFYRAAYFGFLYYDIMGGLLEIALVPIFIYFYNLVFDEKYKLGIKREIGAMSLLFSTIVSLNGRYALGFSLSVLAICLVCLYVSKSAGSLRSGVYGLICGFAVTPSMSPVFAISSMASGLFWKTGKAAAITTYCITCILCGLYVEGWQSLAEYAPEILLCSIIFAPLCSFNLLPKIDIYSDWTERADSDDTERILAEKRQKDTEKRIEALSAAFTELSEMFYTLSDRTRRPALIDTQEICDTVCNSYCPKCLFKHICWEREYSSTRDVFSKIAKELCEKGYAEKDCVDNYFSERCMHMERIIERINDAHGRLLESMIKENKTEVFAMDYESMGRLLEYAVRQNCGEYLADTELSLKLNEASRKLHLSTRNICAYGKRKLSIIAGGIDLGKMKMSASEIKKCYENICGVKLYPPKFDVDGDYITMTLNSARQFAVEYATASCTKKNERFCGDMICMFENGNDYFYSLISDGMGSGREAALTSRLCGAFLKKMLAAGNSKPIALEMLNNFIRSKNTECFSTVDLLEIDLLNGKAGFIKSGAMASYVLREDKIFRIASNTMPIGITRVINAEEVRFELKPNDVIVMVSDGVGQSPEDLVRVSNILTFDNSDDLQTLANTILDSAVKESSRSDDISIGVIRVKEI